jgi:hypothetical protein
MAHIKALTQIIRLDDASVLELVRLLAARAARRDAIADRWEPR